MRKRAQVTIFIIIGMVLIISGSIVLYVTTREVNLESQARRSVSEDVLPVYDFMISCVKQNAKDAIVILGQQGGFIDIPPLIQRTRSMHLPLGAGFMIPYWYYEGDDNSPDIPYMQGEIIRYLGETVPQCLNNFTDFADKYIIEEKSDMVFDVIFARKKVVVSMDYEIDVTISGQTATLDTYVAELGVKLNDMIDLAHRLMIDENENEFIENKTLELMGIDSDIPLNGLEMKCGFQRWPLDDVKTELKQLLKFNLPSIRVMNTDYPPFIEDEKHYRKLEDYTRADYFEGRQPEFVPDDSFEYLKMRWDVGMFPTDLSVNVVYEPHFGMDLNGLPNDNGVLTTKEIKGAQKYLSFLCMNFYHFTYDIIYPVKIVIKDNTAFNGEGFVFQFAFPVLIDNNEGNRESFGIRNFEGYEQDTGFCDDLSGPIVEIVAEGVSEFGAEPLGDVNISMVCFTQRCRLGTTAASFEGDFGTYKLTTPLPLGCSSPFVRAKKAGYLPASKQLTGDSVTLQMKKLVPFDVHVIKHPYFYQTETWLPPEELKSSEHVAIAVDLLGSSYSQYLSWPSNVSQPLYLLDDTASYDFNVLLTLFGDLTGGYNAHNVTIEFDELAGKGEIVFNVFEFRPTIRNEDYIVMITQFMYEGNLTSLKPEFR